MTKNIILLSAIGLLTALISAGCDSSDQPQRRQASCCPSGDHSSHQHEAPPPALPQSLFVHRAHAEAGDLADVLSAAADGQVVTIRGLVGGAKDPFIPHLAALWLVDPKLPKCAADGDDKCPTPWDYCAETRESLAANAVLVSVVGGDGAPLPVELRGAGGIAEMTELTVQGRLRSWHGGPREVQAVTIHVKP